MLKTDSNVVARPLKPLILLGILSGYIRNPLVFVVRVVMKSKKVRKQLDPALADDFASMAALVSSIYLLLQVKVDKEKALSITKAVIIPVGLSVQMANFRYVEDDRIFKNLIAYQQRTNREGPTRLNKMEVIDQNSRCYRFRVHTCMFFKTFSQLGIPELTEVMCEVDNAIFNVYSPERIIFHRDGIRKRIVDGASFCTFVCENRG